MMSWKKTLTFVAIAGLFIVGCTPEDGDAGPVGPVGPEGQIGPKGDNAELNVYNFTVTSANWTSANNGGLNSSSLNLTIADISQEVLDDGAIVGYIKLDAAANTWDDLPLSGHVIYVDGSGNTVLSTRHIKATYELGRVLVTTFVNSNVNLVGPDAVFKFVIIPPSEMIEGVDLENYEAVKTVYGLED